jgi:hypothetical protein
MAAIPPIVASQVRNFLRGAHDDPAFASARALIRELDVGPDPATPIFGPTQELDFKHTFADALAVHTLDDVPVQTVEIPEVIKEIQAWSPHDIVSAFRLRNPGHQHLYPEQLDRFKATAIVDRVPAVGRVMALLAVGSQGTNFAPFRWIDQNSPNYLPWDGVTIERVLNPEVGLTAGSNFQRRFNLILALRDLQSPIVVTLALYCLELIISYPRNADVSIGVNFDVLTRRLLQKTNQDRSTNVSYQQRRSVPVILEGRTEELQGLERLYVDIVQAVLSTVKGAGSSPAYNIIFDSDQVYVTGAQIHYALPNNYPNAAQFPDNAHEDIRAFLRGNFAYALPEELKNYKYYSKLTLNQPDNSDCYCIARSYMYLRLLESERITPDSKAKHMLINSKVAEHDVTSYLDGQCSIMEYLEYLIYRDFELNKFSVPFKCIQLMFLKSLDTGNTPLYPSIRATYQEGQVVYSNPPNEAFLFDSAENELVLVYFKGHIFVSYHGYIAAMLSSQGSIWDRIETVVQSKLPLQYTMKPKRKLPLTASLLRKERSDELQCIDGDLNIRKHAFDFETDSCPCCSTDDKDVQEAYCCAIVSGLKGMKKTFYGRQCCKETGTNLTTSNGCVAQMFRYLDSITDTNNPVDRRRQEYIYAFNGANFDIMFIMKTLVFFNEDFTMMPQGTSILKLKWKNFHFVDFMRMYVPCKLETMYASFEKHHVPEIEEFKPESNKWKAFPYNLIGSSRDYTEEELEDPAIWSSCKVIDEKDARPIHEQCITWWKSKFPGQGYKHLDHLQEYCLADTEILFYCIYVDCYYISRGSVDLERDGKIVKRYYNVNDKITAASRSLGLFQQVFQDSGLHAPTLVKETNIVDSQSQKNLRFDEVIAHSYLGGIVQRYYSGLDSDAELMESYKEAGIKPTIDEFDFNSKYVDVMYRHAIPITFEHEVNYEEPIECDSNTIFVPHHLYRVSMQYPVHTSGTITKVAGFTVAPTFIPHEYSDPCRKNSNRHNFRWGVELKTALDSGCKIRVYDEFKFSSCPIFREFADYCYKRRLEDKKGLFGMFWKLMGNSQYGKWGEAAHARVVFVYNLIDVSSSEGTIVEVRPLQKSIDGRVLYMVRIMDPAAKSIGQFRHMPSFITAVARADLLRAKLLMEMNAYTPLGIPTRAMYCDTDSWKVFNLDYSHPSTIAWEQSEVHPSRLGALKSETDKKGYDLAYFMAKKVNICRADMADIVTNPEFTIKCKGVRKCDIQPEMMTDLATGVVPCMRFDIPLRFIRSFQDGIVKRVEDFRTVTATDRSRHKPDERGWCEPFATISEFVDSLRK